MISVLDGAKNKVILRVKIGIFLRCCKIAYIKSAFLAGGGSAGGELIIFFHEFIFFCPRISRIFVQTSAIKFT